MVFHAVSSDLKKRMDGYVFGIVSIREIAQQPKLESASRSATAEFPCDSLCTKNGDTHTHTVSEREDMCVRERERGGDIGNYDFDLYI